MVILTANTAQVAGRSLVMTTLEMPPEGTQEPLDVANLIRQVNESNEAVKDQCLRAWHAADIARRSGQTAHLAAATAQAAKFAHRTLQAEHPRRRAPLPRQLLLALGTVVSDGVACYFAAQALDGSQDTTIVWTALFLAVLAGGEVGARLLPGSALGRLARGAGRRRCLRARLGRPPVLVPGYHWSGWRDPRSGRSGPVHRCDGRVPVPGLSGAAGGRDAADVAGPPVGAGRGPDRPGNPGRRGPGRARPRTAH